MIRAAFALAPTLLPETRVHLNFSFSRRNQAAFKGFTLIEALVIVLLLTILFVLLVPGSRAKGKPERIKCANNLKLVAFAFRTFAQDHGGHFPFETPEVTESGLDRRAWTQFLVLTNQLVSPRLLLCPGDTHGRTLATDFSGGGCPRLHRSLRQCWSADYSRASVKEIPR